MAWGTNGDFFIGAFYFLLLFLKQAVSVPMLCIPAQKRHRIEDSQSPLAAQIAKEVLVKAHFSVTVSRFMGTNPPSWVQSTGGTPLHLLPRCAVSSLASVCYRQTQGQSLSALLTFGAGKCSVKVCTYFQNELLG